MARRAGIRLLARDRRAGECWVIHYSPPSTLARFMASDSRVRCVVGPVGSGKSTACLMELLRRSRAQAPGPDGLRRTRWGIIRRTYRTLRDTTRRTFEDWVPRHLGEWRE